MKHIPIYCLLLWLYAGNWVLAANCAKPVGGPAQTTVMTADSLVQPKRVKSKNTPATLSLLFGLLGVVAFCIDFAFFTGILFAMGLIFSLLALIFGIVGLKKRKKMLRTLYRFQPDALILPLGQVQSVVGTVLGSIIIGFLLFAIGLAVTRSRSM